MTTPADAQTSPHGPQARQESPPDDTAQPPDDDAADQPPQEPAESERTAANSEAARYRKAARKAEAERDAMAERVAAYQRRECERLVADQLAQASDVWEIGHADPADFYDGDVLEEDHLRAAVAALLDMRPGLAKTAARRRQWGQYGSNPTGEVGWGQVLKQ